MARGKKKKNRRVKKKERRVKMMNVVGFKRKHVPHNVGGFIN